MTIDAPPPPHLKAKKRWVSRRGRGLFVSSFLSGHSAFVTLILPAAVTVPCSGCLFLGPLFFFVLLYVELSLIENLH